jgi:hypothetical protein
MINEWSDRQPEQKLSPPQRVEPLRFGGTPNENCDAAFESSQAVLAFLEGIEGQQ